MQGYQDWRVALYLGFPDSVSTVTRLNGDCSCLTPSDVLGINRVHHVHIIQCTHMYNVHVHVYMHTPLSVPFQNVLSVLMHFSPPKRSKYTLYIIHIHIHQYARIHCVHTLYILRTLCTAQ